MVVVGFVWVVVFLGGGVVDVFFLLRSSFFVLPSSFSFLPFLQCLGKIKHSESSRSHLVASIMIEATDKQTKLTTSGKLTMVDLAGSESQKKTGATGTQLKEANAINSSLSALGNVISALTSGQKHIPYRNSRLTELLQDGLGGNAKTLLFVNASPADYNFNETCGSFEFALRCKQVQNGKGAAAVETAEVMALRKELQKLKAKHGAQEQTEI
jgi:hypothetical protein